MKFLAIFAVAALAHPAQATPVSASCEQGLAAALAELERAEAANSSGQLEACIPSKNKARTTETIRKELAKAKADWAEGWAEHQAIRPMMEKLGAYRGRGGSHICEGPKEHQELAKLAHKAAGPAQQKLSSTAYAIGFLSASFEKEYGYRWRTPESFLPLRFKTSCRDTQRNVEAVRKALKPAVAACKAEYEEARATGDDAADLGITVADDCKVVKPRCEAVPYAGDRNGYNYGIDIFYNYVRLENSKEYSTDTLEDRNAALERIRGCCERDRDPYDCQE